ncbi:unknown [Blautia obeum CAG:39]|nr:unknown [Blautia obeum CAG:39]
MEGIREKVRKETSFCIFYILDIAEQTQSRTISDTSNDSIQSDGCKLIHKRLHANPVIAHEHHSFFTIFMDNVYHLFGKLRNFSSLKSLEIFEFFGRNTVCIVHVALVDNVFRTERIAHFFFKLFEDIWADRCGVAEPVYVFFSRKLIKDQGKLVKKCRKTYYIHILMRIKETAETLQGMRSCLWLTHIKSDLRLHVLPVIYNCIIHMYRVPHDICQEADGIFMKKLRRCDHNISALFVIRPLVCRNDFACGTVNDFPPSGDIVTGIYFQHVRVEMVHKVDLKFLICCCMERAHDVHLLDLIRICLCPCVIFSCCIVGSVDLCTRIF